MAMALIGMGLAAAASAQYIPGSGGVAEPEIPSRSTLDEAYSESPWRLGALRMQPWLGIEDASYVTNQSPDPSIREETDFTVTLGAGLRAYGRTSPKVILALHVLPEYIWWQDDSSRNQLAGRYGVGVFAYLNRLELEASLRFSEQQQFFSDEVQVLTSSETEVAKLAAVLELRRGIKIFAVARTSDVGTDSEDFQIFSRLDRREERFAVGIQLESQGGLVASLGFEETTTDFESLARDLSNDGTTVALGLGYDRARSGVRGTIAFRDIEPASGSNFLPFDDVTGNVELSWQPTTNTGLGVFFDRSQTYSVQLDQSYFISDRVGLLAGQSFGRTRLNVVLATGEDDYEGVLGGTGVDRLDDVTEATAVWQIPIGDLLVLGLQGRFADYDSNIVGFDRDITSYGLSLGLGRIIDKLRVGDGDRLW